MKLGTFAMACLGAALVTSSPAPAQSQMTDLDRRSARALPAKSEGESAKATFIDGRGRPVGTATLTHTPNGVLIQARLEGLSSSEHAFHIHETGKCDPQSRFESAGAHHALLGEAHGFRIEDGPHAGDLPNQFVSDGGMLQLNVVNDRVTLGRGPATLFDADGSALVIHAGADDYRSQPSGSAGDRIACAVVQRAVGIAGADTMLRPATPPATSREPAGPSAPPAQR